MANWSKRTFAVGQVAVWAAVQNAFKDHFMRLMPQSDMVASRKEMMLVKVGRPGREATLYMALPDGEAAYEGFEPAEFAEIPPRPDLLVGNQIGYDELFGAA